MKNNKEKINKRSGIERINISEVGSKIIQIQNAGDYVFCLCEDGSLWVINSKNRKKTKI